MLGEGYYDKLLNKWWENYAGEENVLIDDIGPNCIGASHMKRWLDKRKFKAEIKFGSCDIRPLVIIITSNYHPKEIWPEPADYEPILDRIELIHLDKLRQFDDTPSKRKASKELNQPRPKLVRQDALADFAGTAEQRAALLATSDPEVVEVFEIEDESFELDEM